MCDMMPPRRGFFSRSAKLGIAISRCDNEAGVKLRTGDAASLAASSSGFGRANSSCISYLVISSRWILKSSRRDNEAGVKRQGGVTVSLGSIASIWNSFGQNDVSLSCISWFFFLFPSCTDRNTSNMTDNEAGVKLHSDL